MESYYPLNLMSNHSKKLLKEAIEKQGSSGKCIHTPEMQGLMHGEQGGAWLCNYVGCTQISDWVIYYANRPPGEHRHVCTEHVGFLLEEGIQHTIYPIIRYE